MTLKSIDDIIFCDNKKLNSLAIAVRSPKAKNHAENIKYDIFYRSDGEQLFIFFTVGWFL